MKKKFVQRYTNIFEKKKFVWGFASHQKASRVWDFFLGLVEPSRNKLVSMAYFAKPGFSVLHE